MPVRTANAEWRGDLRTGSGRLGVESESLDTPYGYRSRFETGEGTNPEELIAAAHAGCFSMSLGKALADAGTPARSVHTTARVHLEQGSITRIRLETSAEAPKAADAAFQEIARKAKETCIVSRALASVPIELVARLVRTAA